MRTTTLKGDSRSSFAVCRASDIPWPEEFIPKPGLRRQNCRVRITYKGEESKPLLPPASSPPNKSINGVDSCCSLPSARTDEQALLSSILAKTAINIIDVSAADQQQMEQHEYMDRARQYSTRLAMLSSSLTHWKKLPLLPSLTNQPHQVLASDPVPFADLQQVSRIAAYAYSALSQIRVDAKEELVVQFGIP
ncbi:ragulator complex protein LAMTOR1 [Python bivittatus]|uniref:Ragulator complex protein LAMTOR1 n=1 Tax=Python bivittatus TaxID=176946 RepID=A0A9F5IL10_PYTBI|nr:ragulator complex protein LAMTOR1 [Python bivittatus]